MLLEEGLQVLGVSADGVGFPAGAGAGRVGHVELGLFGFFVKADQEDGAAEGSDGGSLGVLLLDLGNEF